MKPSSITDALAMFHGFPFSFIENAGTQATVLSLGISTVVTAANSVSWDQQYRRFSVSTGWF